MARSPGLDYYPLPKPGERCPVRGLAQTLHLGPISNGVFGWSGHSALHEYHGTVMTIDDCEPCDAASLQTKLSVLILQLAVDKRPAAYDDLAWHHELVKRN